MAADLIKMDEDAHKVCPAEWAYEPNYDFEITMNSDGRMESILTTNNNATSGTLDNIECIKTAIENIQYNCLHDVKINISNPIP
ncbi:MAG: hypothetical protein JXR91_11135 [Deltaproteobacteria bacterium]|nr:hypothetical protein [Deltaproteobacteria bacterium]